MTYIRRVYCNTRINLKLTINTKAKINFQNGLKEIFLLMNNSAFYHLMSRWQFPFQPSTYRFSLASSGRNGRVGLGVRRSGRGLRRGGDGGGRVGAGGGRQTAGAGRGKKSRRNVWHYYRCGHRHIGVFGGGTLPCCDTATKC